MILHSIRWRLQIWHGLLLLAVLTGFGFTAWRVASDTVWNRIDSELDESLEAVFRPPFNARPAATAAAWIIRARPRRFS